MREAKIVLLSTVAAVAYGIVHDQITARLCVEYFTIAHPPLFHTTSPTILGLCWGTAATFGVGLLLGVVLALVSQSEGLPPVPTPHLFKSILGLLAVTALSGSSFRDGRSSVFRPLLQTSFRPASITDSWPSGLSTARATSSA
jgi:hypothetical protein